MSIQNVPLMKAISAKMGYLDKRQGVLAQNIANADTPSYQSQDLTKVDFGSVLKGLTKTNTVRLATTQPGHMPNPDDITRSKDVKDKLTYEVAPDGNGVIMEEQMIKANQTSMDYNLMTNLMNKQVSMYRLALGRQG